MNFSKEKGLIVKAQGREAFLKLKAVEEDGKIQYSTVPVEVYITCGGKTYGFIGRPQKVPTRTIYLVDPAKEIDKAAASLGTSEVDQAVVRILRAVYRDLIPEAWEWISGGNRYQLKGLAVLNRANWKIPGVGIVVRQFEISNSQNNSISIEERDFLDPEVIRNPIAISIQNHRISSGLSSRAVVIEKFIED